MTTCSCHNLPPPDCPNVRSGRKAEGYGAATKPATDPVMDMAKRAAKECELARINPEGWRQLIEAETAIISRHYREGVRELVLAARWVANPHQDPLSEYDLPPELSLPPSRDSVDKLRAALEEFKDVE